MKWEPSPMGVVYDILPDPKYFNALLGITSFDHSREVWSSSGQNSLKLLFESALYFLVIYTGSVRVDVVFIDFCQ